MYTIYNAVYGMCAGVVSIGVLVSQSFYYYRDLLEKRIEPWLLMIPWWITPDRLSWSRVPLGMLVVCFLFFYPIRVLANFIYTIAWITDVLDGELARCRRQFSIWGSRIDPLVDKILNDSIFIGYTYVYAYPKDAELSSAFYELLIIIFADLATLIAAGLLYYFFEMRVKSGFIGKWKFFTQCVGCTMLNLTWFDNAIPIIKVAAVLGILSVIGYGYSGYKELRARKV